MSELNRSLGVWHGVGLYCGSVLGTGVLVLPGIAAATAGPASIFAWLALILLSAPMALTYAALSVQRPDAGGFSTAIERAFGPKWGAVAGWLFVSQFPTGAVVAALIAGHSAASVFGGSPETALALGAGLIAVAYALNFAGLRVSAGAQLATLGVITAGLVVIVAFALPDVKGEAFTPLFPHGKLAVGLAAVQLFWAFVGWEAITPLAGEFKHTRDIWRASVASVVIVGVIYMLLAVAVVGTAGPGASAEAPLVRLAAGVFGTSAARVVGIAGFLLSFIPVNAYVAGTSRLVFSLGERRQLPAWLGVTSRNGTPVRALAALGVGSALGLAIAASARLGIDDLLPYSAAAFIATYVLSMAAAVRLLKPPMSYAAIVSLVACTIVMAFVGPVLIWIVAVSICALTYQRFVTRRAARQERAPQPAE